MKTAYLKIAFPVVLGCKYKAVVTGKFSTKAEAEADTAPGKIFSVINGRKAIKDWNNK